MRHTISIAPPNSMLFISDRTGGQIPEITRERRIWSTASCVAFGCLMFMDGATEVTLGDIDDVNSDSQPAFDRVLQTPGHSVVVSTVEGKAVLICSVSDARTRVRIWTNHPTEPDKVMIGLG